MIILCFPVFLCSITVFDSGYAILMIISLCLFLTPFIINVWSHAVVSTRRLHKFLTSEELTPNSRNPPQYDENVSIACSGLQFLVGNERKSYKPLQYLQNVTKNMVITYRVDSRARDARHPAFLFAFPRF